MMVEAEYLIDEFKAMVERTGAALKVLSDDSVWVGECAFLDWKVLTLSVLNTPNVIVLSVLDESDGEQRLVFRAVLVRDWKVEVKVMNRKSVSARFHRDSFVNFERIFTRLLRLKVDRENERVELLVL
jgi:hypothetical protein